jgi:hypothetical protein
MEAGKILLIWSLILLGLMTACVKDPQDIPPGITYDGVFGMTAGFDNESLQIEAGRDLWTMLPVVGQKDSLNVYTGVLSVDGCLEQ